MGVDGLWPLLEPVARPIALETMGNKRLAIDSSIWLYQFQHATRDRDGRTLDNAHILGFVSRIKKLLHFGIKPVFVFDGGAPAIKRIALAKRQKRKREGDEDTRTVATKLLAAKLRAAAVDEARDRAGTSAAKRASRSVQAADGTGDLIGDDAVYLEDLGDGGLEPVMHPRPMRGRGDADDGEYEPRSSPARGRPSSSPETTRTDGPPAAKKKKYVHRDDYALPALDGSIQSRASLNDPRMATEAELREAFEEFRPDDFNLDSAEFASLSAETKYQIVGDLRVKSRQPNWRRVEQMRMLPTALDFSKQQVLGLQGRNKMTQRLFEVTEAISHTPGSQGLAPGAAKPMRIAGERGRAYMLVKNDASKGGGYVLGMPGYVEGTAGEGTATAPLTFAGSTDGDTTGESDAFDEVPIPARPVVLPHIEEERRDRSTQAFIQRYTAAPAAPHSDPYLDEQAAHVPDAQPLFLDGVDDELMAAAGADEALLQDILAHVGRAENERFREPVASTSGGPAVAMAQDEDSDGSLEYVDPDAPMMRPTVSTEPGEPSSSDDAEFEEVEPVAPAVVKPPVATVPNSSDVEFEEVELAPRPKPVQPIVRPQPGVRAPQAASRPTPAPKPVTRPAPAPRPIPAPRPAPPRQPPKPAEPIEIPDSSDEDAMATDPAPAPKPISASQQRSIAPLPRRASPPPRQSSPPAPGDGVISRDFVSPPPSPPAPQPQPIAVVRVPSPPVVASSPGPTLMQQVVDGDAEPSARDLDKGRLQLSAAQTVVEAAREPSPPRPIPRAPSPAAKDDGNDSDAVSDWSRSPTPPPRSSPAKIPPPKAAPAAPPRAGPSTAGPSRARDKPVDFEDEAREANEDVARLQQQSRKAQQMATDVTQQMSHEVQTMLRHFGIPYVVAPMEAEAQCAELVQRNLVDGIVTDDSDVLLFGGTRVYRHMFTAHKDVECYVAADIEAQLHLTRDMLISLAYLLGSDYSEGLRGIGGVIAMQILAEFPGPTCVRDFANWWRRAQFGQDTAEERKSAFKKSLKKRQKDMVLEESWPDPRVVRSTSLGTPLTRQREAYVAPTVDHSDERFSWGVVDLEGLRAFLKDSLGWNADKVDNTIQPVIKVMNERRKGVANMQGSLEKFFDVSAGTGAFRGNVKFKSQKLENVIKTFRRQKALAAGEDPPSESEDEPQPKKPRKPRKSRKATTPDSDEEADELWDSDAPAPVVKPRPKRKSRAKPKAPTAELQSEDDEPAPAPAPVKVRAPPPPPPAPVRAPMMARKLSAQEQIADAAIAHLPAPRPRSGVTPNPVASTSKPAKAKPKAGASTSTITEPAKPKPKKRKFGTARTAAERRRHRVASDDEGWTNGGPRRS